MGPGIIRLPRALACGARRPRIAACALLAAALLFPTHAFAQQLTQGGSATAQTQVAMLTPGSVEKSADMDFGSIAQSNTAGTIVLSPQAAATCTVSGTLIRTGNCRAAAFSIYGRHNNKVRIEDSAGSRQITLVGPGGATMLLTNMQIGVSGMSAVNGANGWDFGNWHIDTNSGITDFFIGGTLNVGAAQAAGVYNGTIVININFN